MIGKILVRCSVAAVAMQFLVSSARAVDTMSDWTGQNSNPANTTFTLVTTGNNYGLISDTSVGGTIQSKVNFHNVGEPTYTGIIDEPHIYFSDPTLSAALDFTTPLHMEGTITINSPTDTEPNLLFGWYSSVNTAHRIGLGISNRSVAQGGAIANRLRMDFGYAATGGNRFHYVSPDGATVNTAVDSTVPNGTYPFTFDYVPGNSPGTGGGSMSATVGTFFKTVTPLETDVEDLDLFSLDRFGFVQRSTANVTNNPTNTYNVTFSNVTYTGGTAAAVTIPGDFDSNGSVNLADLDNWTDNYGTGTTIATGDADADGDADGDDFLIWQRNLQGTPVTAIPEPATLVLLSVAGVAMLLRRRR